MLLAPLTLLSHYPLSPCVNIYHSNINCSSFQLFPSPLNLFSGHTLVIHHLHLCLFMQRLAAQFGYDLNVPLLYSLTLLFFSPLLSAAFLTTIWLIDILLRPIMQM